jgi:hypothetical protein
MKKWLAGTALAALVLGSGIALAQLTPPLSFDTTVSQSDAVQVIPGGVSKPTNNYLAPGQIGAMLNESVQVPLTAFTITPNDNVSLLFLNPAGTLATGTITFPAHPSDGGAFCWLSSQTQTAVTMTANTGQSVVGTAVTAGVAGTSYCWRYIATTATWYRTQ